MNLSFLVESVVRLGYFLLLKMEHFLFSTFVKSFLGLVEFEKLQRKDIKMFTDIFIKEMTFLSKFSQLASSLRVDSAKVGL